MKKTLLFILIASSLHVSSLHAQFPEENTDLDQISLNAASDFCDCINNILAGYHPAIREFLHNFVEKGERESQEILQNRILKASLEEQGTIMQDLEQLQQFDRIFNDTCGKELAQKYASYDQETAFEQKLLKNLKKTQNCKLTYSLMKMSPPK